MPLTDNTAVAYRLRFFMMVQEWFPFDISYRHEGNVLLYFGGVLSLGNTPMSKQDTVASGLRVHLHQQGFT